jgi:very-short-patch-repair endonuclease
VIEVDGEAHNRGDAPKKDERRDGWFAARGLTVLRLPAVAILNELEAAVMGIMTLAKGQIGED